MIAEVNAECLATSAKTLYNNSRYIPLTGLTIY